MSDTATKTQQPEQAQETVTLTVDGQSVTVNKGMTVLDACRQIDIPVPTFCWHPKLKSVGACRICYVEIEKFPKLMVSCATEAMNDMVVFTDSEKCREGRKAVIEFILLDHPLDCPTCDKGGECDLQDNAFEYGLTDDSNFEFRKFRHIRDKDSTFDDLKIGPEMIRNQNRCVLCYKCTRANEEAFGENDIGIYQRGSITEINAKPGGQVESLYSGNLVEICPVGALTASDWRYKIRVWNTTTVDSVCPFHADGANTTLWRDRTKVLRTTSRPNDAVDDGWLSDITRYGYQIANSEERLKTPLIKKGGKHVEASWDEALALIAEKIKELKGAKGSPCIAGVISPSLDLASLHCFNKLMRGALGANSVDYRSDYTALPTESGSVYAYMASRDFSIAAVDNADAILVVGSNLIREHPNVHLRVRKAVNNSNSWLYTANPLVTKSADCSTDEMLYRPGTDEVFLNGLALSLIDQGLAKSEVDVSRVNTLLAPNSVSECANVCGVSKERIDSCARKLAESKQPTIIGGELVSGSIDREKIANALFNLAVLLDVSLGDSGEKGQACILPRAANSKGAEALAITPELSNEDKFRLARVIGELPELPGRNWDSMISGAQGEEVKAMLIVGANPAQLSPDQRAVRKALESIEFLVVADLFETPTTQYADVVLPLASFAEYDGGFVNLEGRQQEFTAARKPIGSALAGYLALNRIADALGYSLYSDESTLNKEIADLLDNYTAPTRRPLLMESHHTPQERPEESYPLFVGDALHHFGHWTEFCESLKSFESKAKLEISPELADKLSVTEGDKVRVSAGEKKLNLKVRISELLEGDTLFAPHNFSATAINALRKADQRNCFVRIKVTESAL